MQIPCFELGRHSHMISKLNDSTDYHPLSWASAEVSADLTAGAKKDAVLTLWVYHVCGTLSWPQMSWP